MGQTPKTSETSEAVKHLNWIQIPLSYFQELMSVNNGNLYWNGIIMYMLKLDVDFLVNESS